jgi:beta-galactosidase/beta-glucuronidase
MILNFSNNATSAKGFVVDKEWDVKNLITELEGIPRIPEVYVNGDQVRKDGDSYLSFLLELSSKLNFGEENIVFLNENPDEDYYNRLCG